MKKQLLDLTFREKRMRQTMKKIVSLLLALMAWIPASAFAEESKDQPDPLCQMLFDAYIARTAKINTSCKAALGQLSGRTDVKTRQEWEAWWKQTDKKAIPRGRVELIDS